MNAIFCIRAQIALAALVWLAGCAQLPGNAAEPRANVNLSGYTPEFRAGYADGCASASAGAALKRDSARFKADANYAQGWQDGHDICARR